MEALEVAPSTYYSKKSRPPSKRSFSDAVLLPLLFALWTANYSVYGRRKLWQAALRDGLCVGRDQVARLMRLGNMAGARRHRRHVTTKRDDTAARAPDLLGRDFSASCPNSKWVCDFTYALTASGVVYVAFVVDCFSRRIVGWKAARSMTKALVIDALNMAAWSRRNVSLSGLLCHSDAGSQYTSVAYSERLADIGAVPSIGSVGTSYDNALAETTNGLFKTELLYNPAVLERHGGSWRGLADLEAAISAWVEWFNERRIHAALCYRTPAEVELTYAASHKHAA